MRIGANPLRKLLAEKVESSNLPSEQKSTLTDAMRRLPAHALQGLVTRLVNEAVHAGRTSATSNVCRSPAIGFRRR